LGHRALRMFSTLYYLTIKTVLTSYIVERKIGLTYEITVGG
jgi:hypothetical protein